MYDLSGQQQSLRKDGKRQEGSHSAEYLTGGETHDKDT